MYKCAPSSIVGAVLSDSSSPLLVSLPFDVLSSDEIRINEQVFVDAKEGDWLGFYDWLRCRRDGVVDIVGVRLYLDRDIDGLRLIEKFVGADISERSVMIFFSDRRVWDESISCDQNFGDNKLYINEARNSILITFCPPGDVDAEI